MKQIPFMILWEKVNSDSFLLFEWTSLITLPLVTQQDIPETGLHIMPCYGSIHHSWDYPYVDGFAYPDIAEYIPPVLEATKIGGNLSPTRRGAAWHWRLFL